MPSEDAGGKLKALFSSIRPSTYVMLNRVLSLYQDGAWRRRAAAELLIEGAGRILDLCCGTGDLALEVARRARSSKDGLYEAPAVEGAPPAVSMDGAVEIRGLDFCPSFLEYARARARAEGFSIDFAEGDAGAMPFPDSFFDAVGLAFAFRNLTYRNARSALYLSEILRVLRPRGRLVFVETSQPGLELFKFFNHLYLRLLVPAAGRLLAGGTKAYDYLAESVAGYYTREELARLLEGAGFIEVTTVPLCLGAVALVTARKPS